MVASTMPTVTVEGENLRIRVSMALKRRGGRKEIIVPEGLGGAPSPRGRNRPLAIAVARAHRWQRLLEVGWVRDQVEGEVLWATATVLDPTTCEFRLKGPSGVFVWFQFMRKEFNVQRARKRFGRVQ